MHLYTCTMYMYQEMQPDFVYNWIFECFLSITLNSLVEDNSIDKR